MIKQGVSTVDSSTVCWSTAMIDPQRYLIWKAYSKYSGVFTALATGMIKQGVSTVDSSTVCWSTAMIDPQRYPI